MDIGTLSIIVLLGMLFLLAIGMHLGFASGFLAFCGAVFEIWSRCAVSHTRAGGL